MVFGAHSKVQLFSNLEKYAWRDDDGLSLSYGL